MRFCVDLFPFRDSGVLDCFIIIYKRGFAFPFPYSTLLPLLPPPFPLSFTLPRPATKPHRPSSAPGFRHHGHDFIDAAHPAAAALDEPFDGLCDPLLAVFFPASVPAERSLFRFLRRAIPDPTADHRGSLPHAHGLQPRALFHRPVHFDPGTRPQCRLG